MKLNLDNVQGNIFGGFNKDFQDFIFLKVASAANARKWVRDNAAELISTSRQVIAYNNSFKQLIAEGVQAPEDVIPARWANLAFSFKGLQALGFTNADFGTLPVAYTDGMAQRHAVIGDQGASAPQHWDAPFDPANVNNVHAVLLVAADNAADLAAHTQTVTGSGGFAGAFTVLGTVQGRTRMDNPLTIGHEHFGFKDGVSQPGLRGINQPDDPLADPDQGHPGQDLLWPGEFVLGYPTQIPTVKAGHDGPNPDPGPKSTAGNATWTNDGSFLVFRRLQQDVPGFEKQIYTLSAQHGTTAELMGAKLVGRYKSGCPLETLSVLPFDSAAPSFDPGTVHPELANSDTLDNAFEYGDDPAGARCPLGAHIRKAYPRDEETGHGASSESETQTHRLLRRGIPYGVSYDASVPGSANVKRGLCFLAYQSDIQRQFEFVQASWVNNAAFPPPGNAGQDPVIAQSANGPYSIPGMANAMTIAHFVQTTGGEYFFAPSLATLQAF